jgi:phosphinothricin acetyltransferase
LSDGARIRLAHEGDAAAIAAIYAPFVRDTAVSFEVEPPTAEEFGGRLRNVLTHAPWLVCERNGALAGYAYAGRFHARAAYQWTVETTVYVRPEDQRRSVGLALYTALLDALRLQTFRSAIGAITLPNPASVGLHERLGFRCAALLHAVGWKHGRWHDVGWWQLALAEGDGPPSPPRPLAAVVGTPAWEALIARAVATVRPA